jgi:hypothetical protein
LRLAVLVWLLISTLRCVQVPPMPRETAPSRLGGRLGAPIYDQLFFTRPGTSTAAWHIGTNGARSKWSLGTETMALAQRVARERTRAGSWSKASPLMFQSLAHVAESQRLDDCMQTLAKMERCERADHPLERELRKQRSEWRAVMEERKLQARLSMLGIDPLRQADPASTVDVTSRVPPSGTRAAAATGTSVPSRRTRPQTAPPRPGVGGRPMYASARQRQSELSTWSRSPAPACGGTSRSNASTKCVAITAAHGTPHSISLHHHIMLPGLG